MNQIHNPITYLPYPCYARTSECLHNEELWHTRVAALTILEVLLELPTTFPTPKAGLQEHPCVRMWRGYEHALVNYAFICNLEWKLRGHEETLTDKIATLQKCIPTKYEVPWWKFIDSITHSHRKALLRNRRSHYRLYFTEDKESKIASGILFWPVAEQVASMPF